MRSNLSDEVGVDDSFHRDFDKVFRMSNGLYRIAPEILFNVWPALEKMSLMSQSENPLKGHFPGCFSSHRPNQRLSLGDLFIFYIQLHAVLDTVDPGSYGLKLNVFFKIDFKVTVV